MTQDFTQHETVQNRLSKQAKAATENWIANCQHPLFGSLLFHSNAPINEHRRRKLLRLFFGKMDSLYFGNSASRKNMRIPRHVGIHRGSNGDNLHAHFVITPIGDTDQFCKIARLCWASLSNETYRYDDVKIEVARDQNDAARYLLHENFRSGEYCPLLSAQSIAGQKIAACNAELDFHQKNRIQRFVKKNEGHW